MANHLRPGRRQGGFTILEMSVVLVVIALLLGAVSVGRDLYRSAMAERIGSEFVQGWIIAYDRYVAQTGTVPGDSLSNPTGRVNGSVGGTPLCDVSDAQRDLRDAMLERGVSLPQGRAEGQESILVYQDSNGLPQELQICFLAVNDWAEPGPANTYVHRVRNVMRIEGLTPELAHQLDSRIDGRVDARFGRMREATPGSLRYNVTTGLGGGAPPDHPWSLDNTARVGGSTDEDDQVATLTAYIKMNQ